MVFISYAQNFEDVLLWRALGHVEGGFYIDVGANDPSLDSVTLAFYERGWRGINIEPMRQYFDQLQAARPADVNLQLAMGDSVGQLTFFDFPDTGLSTADPEIAQAHVAAGFRRVERQIPVKTLAAICAEHVLGPIHFLKVDVEGFEAAVLRGMDFHRWRPWILLVEATRPLSRILSHQEWEQGLIENGYRFACFDGLNRFYVAEERAELLEALATPPNILDGFCLRPGHWLSHPQRELEERLREVEQKLARAEERARHSEAATLENRALLEQTEQRCRKAEAQVAAIEASTSWRLTEPLRRLVDRLRRRTGFTP